MNIKKFSEINEEIEHPGITGIVLIVGLMLKLIKIFQ